MTTATTLPLTPLERIRASESCGAVPFECVETFRDESPRVALLAVHARAVDGPRVVVTARVAQAREWLAAHTLDVQALGELGALLEAPVIDLWGPWPLEPVCIAKPWGQEIWYTGIEKRGQSRVGDGRWSIPLPWLLALSAEQLLAPDVREPALLKILDPLPEEVFGDLYFELHEQKREVYVVTRVDPLAWPNGEGGIRFGFDQAVRGQYPSDGDFRQAFRQAVADYEVVRRAIDRHCDGLRLVEGIPPREPVDAETLRRWLDTVPEDLVARERQCRAAMNRFTHMLPLRVGDVVKVPCLTPHALQHGVRTVEFQTPVYERQILSFAQKVLTQDHWDTERAVELMSLDAGVLEPLEVIDEAGGQIVERVVRFSDFEVLRLTLSPGEQRGLAVDHYALVMVVEGRPSVGARRCRPEQALLIPRGAASQTLTASDERAVLLICLPVIP